MKCRIKFANTEKARLKDLVMYPYTAGRVIKYIDELRQAAIWAKRGE